MSAVSESISLLNIDIPEEILLNMRKQVQYLNFLRIVSARDFPIRPCSGIFENTLLFLQASDVKLQSLIAESVENIEVQINNALGNLEITIKNCYTEKMQSLDIKQLLRMLRNDTYVWRKKMDTIMHLKHTEFIEAFCNIEQDLEINFPENFVSKVSEIRDFLLDLESLNITSINIKQTPWLRVSQNLDTFIQESENKYEFLTDLYVKLSSYEIQKNKNDYKKDWETSGIANGIEVETEFYSIFLKKISELPLNKNSTIPNLQFTELQQELNHVLSLTMKNDVKINCSDTTLMVQGDNISLKDILRKDEFCEILSESRIVTVCFFASNIIFIDKDLNFIGKRLSLAIVAPTWEVIGSRKIDLSGETGDDHEARENGEPGRPGGPGGNFFGIGETFVNEDNLTVITSGGKGGDGQRGQDGEDKRDAVLDDRDLSISSLSERLPQWAQAIFFGLSWVSDVKAVKVGSGIFLASSLVLPHLAGAIMEENKFVIDEGGGMGGDGRDGGRGGNGGNPGNIFILELKGDSKITRVSNEGERGTDGEGGRGGNTGMKKVVTGNLRDGVLIRLEEGGDPGADGKEGANSINIQRADAPPEFPDMDEIVENYKDFLKESLIDRFKKYHLEEFINLLDSKRSV